MLVTSGAVRAVAKQRQRFILGASERGFPAKKVAKILKMWVLRKCSHLKLVYSAIGSGARKQPPLLYSSSIMRFSSGARIDYLMECWLATLVLIG